MVSLRPTPMEDAASSRLEDGKGYLCLLLCTKLEASISLCKVRGREPTCPERLLCLRYFGTSGNSLPSFTQRYGVSQKVPCFFFLHSSLLSQSIIKAANLSGRNFTDIAINISSPKIISSSTLKFLLLSLRVKCQVKPNLFILTHTRTRPLRSSLHSGGR